MLEVGRMKATAYIGLGSNLASSAGDPAETVRAAIGALSATGTVDAVSSLYRTQPVGYREQPYFINAVARVVTQLEPEALLRALLEIERAFGRDRRLSVPKGPRTLDLDLLLVFQSDSRDAIVYDIPSLKLPHPEIVNRRFVLEPLAEVAPELRLPASGKTTRELLEAHLAGGGAEEEVTRI